MKTPLSWIKEFIDIELPIDELAYRLTMAGLEVEEIRYVGIPIPEGGGNSDLRMDTKISGFGWDREKIVVGAIHEVMPHPNADRLVLCKLDDGEQIHTVLTGAPNLFEFRGIGPLAKPLKVAYAREGSIIMDAYSEEEGKTAVLKRRKIRGVESYSMACSEKELGISDEHEGIIILDNDAPVGIPLADYMGDVVFDIAITPNIARNANILGVAREIAAITGTKIRYPDLTLQADGPSIAGRVNIEITQPELNPRFVLGLVENITLKPSPYEIQRRLTLAGMRPINNIVDATNYAMFELGEPLHAFDFNVLKSRAGEHPPTIITRAAKKGETLRTLDGVNRKLDDFTVLVCDQTGPLALAGVMGGAESEVQDSTVNILLEGAAWNMINTQRTVVSQKLHSEAAYRFSRGVHPAMAMRGVQRGLQLMYTWGGGTIAQGFVDNYPKPPIDPTVTIQVSDVQRWLGVSLSKDEVSSILKGLEFSVTIEGSTIHVTSPDHRMDIGTGVIGKADLMEEIARIYGYDRIPETRMADDLPPQMGNPELDQEEKIRDLLVAAGLQEVITHRVTTPENEARRLSPETPPDNTPYFRIANPITSERTVMRKSLLSSVINVVEHNARIQERMALFEIAPVFLTSEEGELPDEVSTLVIAMTGNRELLTWQGADNAPMDFFDLKGVIETLFDGLHIDAIYEPGNHPSFHPGKCAYVITNKTRLGVMGVLHPQVSERYDLPETPLLVAEINMDALLNNMPERFETAVVSQFPPVHEDLALILDEAVPAVIVENLIKQTGSSMVTNVRLFDVYRGQQIGTGKKSLAYAITYQADRTLTDKEVAKIRERIVQRLERELNAKLRSE